MNKKKINKKELKKWFINKLYSCYTIKKDDSIYYIYDEQFLRQKKLCRILNEKLENSKINNKSEILFKQDLKNDILWCDHKKIWSFFENNYSRKYNEIQLFIEDTLWDIENLKQCTPLAVDSVGWINFDRHNLLYDRYFKLINK